MKKKLITEHYRWMKTGVLDENGLCGQFLWREAFSKYRNTFSLFEPDAEEKHELRKAGLPDYFWGSETESFRNRGYYTLRRQTIVLFICAMHGEI